jgi:uncharacterized protein (TIGR03435 family)
VTVGLLHSEVILPLQWRDWPQAKLDAVLAHEGEHARRHDPLTQWLAMLNRALFWFHPVSWWLARHLSALAEEACDNAVLSRGYSPKDYVEYLMEMARSVEHLGGRLKVFGVAMPGGSLSQRVRRIAKGSPIERISRWRMVSVAAVCMVTCAIFAAGNLESTQADKPAVANLYQSSAAPTPPTSSSRFNSVTIRVNGSVDAPPGVGFTTANTSLGLLMVSAYQLPESQFLGLPDWTDSDRFEIHATAIGNPKEEQTNLMWQSLLVDRFKLRMHHEARQLPFYELEMVTPGRLGPQLHRNDKQCDPQAAMGTPRSLGCASVSGRTTTRTLTYTVRGMTIQEFFAALAGFGSNEKRDRWGMNRNIDRPIDDRTGLNEKFDLTLEFAPLWPGFDVLTGPSAPPSLATALREQLGVKLEPRTGLVDVLVIDHVEKPTGGNF